MKRFRHWSVDDEAKVPVATAFGESWARVTETTDGGAIVEFRVCGQLDRFEVPVEVLQALLDAATKRRRPPRA